MKVVIQKQHLNRSQAILEAVDGFLLRPALRDAFFKEKNKFGKQSTRTPLAQMTRTVRELVDNQSFDCSTNPWTLPTIGQDGQSSYFDQNPGARMAPVFKKRLTEAFATDKAKTKRNPPPAFASKKKAKQPQQEQPSVPDPGQEQVQQAGAEQGAQQQQLLQQQQQGLQQQQAGMPGATPQDMMAGSAPPPVPELPGDLRRSPDWEGNRAAAISKGLQTYSQKVVDRYNLETDPMQSYSGPRTFSKKARIAQTRWGDMTTRPLRNTRTNNGG